MGSEAAGELSLDEFDMAWVPDEETLVPQAVVIPLWYYPVRETGTDAIRRHVDYWLSELRPDISRVSKEREGPPLVAVRQACI